MEPVGHLFVHFDISRGSPWAFFRFNAIPFVPPGSRVDLLVSFGAGIVPKSTQNKSQMDPEHDLEAPSCGVRRSISGPCHAMIIPGSFLSHGGPIGDKRIGCRPRDYLSCLGRGEGRGGGILTNQFELL